MEAAKSKFEQELESQTRLMEAKNANMSKVFEDANAKKNKAEDMLERSHAQASEQQKLVGRLREEHDNESRALQENEKKADAAKVDKMKLNMQKLAADDALQQAKLDKTDADAKVAEANDLKQLVENFKDAVMSFYKTFQEVHFNTENKSVSEYCDEKRNETLPKMSAAYNFYAAYNDFVAKTNELAEGKGQATNLLSLLVDAIDEVHTTGVKQTEDLCQWYNRVPENNMCDDGKSLNKTVPFPLGPCKDGAFDKFKAWSGAKGCKYLDLKPDRECVNMWVRLGIPRIPYTVVLCSQLPLLASARECRSRNPLSTPPVN